MWNLRNRLVCHKTCLGCSCQDHRRDIYKYLMSDASSVVCGGGREWLRPARMLSRMRLLEFEIQDMQDLSHDERRTDRRRPSQKKHDDGVKRQPD